MLTQALYFVLVRNIGSCCDRRLALVLLQDIGSIYTAQGGFTDMSSEMRQGTVNRTTAVVNQARDQRVAIA